MVANAGGPVMSMYFLAARFPINRFLGTAAWFFFVVNVAKTPFSVSLGLISLDSLRLDLLLAPAVIFGALAGVYVDRFDRRLGPVAPSLVSAGLFLLLARVVTPG